MTPEESSVFFNLLSGPASNTKPYPRADYIADDLQGHARGCNLPIAECRLCRLCELEIKRRWPDLWLSKWPGATTADETHDFTGLEFQVIFAVCRGGSNKEIAQQLSMSEQVVMTVLASVYDKAGLLGRSDLVEFVKAALIGELRRRLRDSPEKNHRGKREGDQCT